MGLRMSTNETAETNAPTRYEIQKLLDNAVQPWDPITDAELDALARGIGRRHDDPLAVPVTLSREHQVVDGSQRLLALQKLGKKYIYATDVRVLRQVTRANALEWAVRLNAQRRQLDIPQKARVVRMLMAKNGWSQGRCAKVMGVSPAAVSQWLGQTTPADETDLPTLVEGDNGVLQDVSAKRRARLTQRTTPHPWSEDGNSFALVRKVTSRMSGAMQHSAPLDELSPEEREAMISIVQDLAGTAEDLLRFLEDRLSSSARLPAASAVESAR
jgi:ParB-like chromosome segregation protein Spo0J